MPCQVTTVNQGLIQAFLLQKQKLRPHFSTV